MVLGGLGDGDDYDGSVGGIGGGVRNTIVLLLKRKRGGSGGGWGIKRHVFVVAPHYHHPLPTQHSAKKHTHIPLKKATGLVL